MRVCACILLAVFLWHKIMPFLCKRLLLVLLEGFQSNKEANRTKNFKNRRSPSSSRCCKKKCHSVASSACWMLDVGCCKITKTVKKVVDRTLLHPPHPFPPKTRTPPLTPSHPPTPQPTCQQTVQPTNMKNFPRLRARRSKRRPQITPAAAK